MSLAQAMTFLLWCGEKTLAGDPLTEEDMVLFKEAHKVSKSKASMLLIRPSDYEYKKGQPFC